jgi:hypothetical protein
MRRRGEIGRALLDAALMHGPATVRGLAACSGVAYGAARYTASRMIGRGELVVIDRARPVLVAAPEVVTTGGLDNFMRALALLSARDDTAD